MFIIISSFPPKFNLKSHSTVDSRYNKLLGPSEITLLYIEILLYPGCKNNRIQRNFELWNQENCFVISGFCYISVLYNESPYV